METDMRVDSLIDRWEEMREHGTPLTVEDLCVGHPELVAEVRRRVEALQAMNSALDTEVHEPCAVGGDRDRSSAPRYGMPPEVLRATAVYQARSHHGHGGLGVVFTAYQEELDRTVALKRIRPDKLREAARRRFLREAALTARLQHPGIVPIYGLGEDEGQPFYTMPLIEGQTLQQAIEAVHRDESLRREPGPRSLRFRGLLQHFIAVCNTVAYAHDQGVVHRDLKPSNIMLGPYGETLVMDWGLAKRVGGDDDAGEFGPDAPSPSPSSEDVTNTGEILGTPQYMSPEQAQGAPAGPPGDIFSLGLVLYAILTGKTAFEGWSLWGPDRLKAVREAAIVPPRSRDPRLSRALEAICLKALAARAEDRYASARALGDDVTRWLGDEPVTAWREPLALRARRWGRRHRTTVAAAAVALVAAVIGLGAVATVQVRANVRLRKARDDIAQALETTRKAQAQTQVALAQSEESRKQASAVSAFLVEAFRSPDPSQDGRQVKVADVLDRASDRLDRTFEGSQATRAQLLDALGQTYFGLGLYDKAVNLHTRARAAHEAALGPDHPDTLDSRNNLANAYRSAGRTAEAIALYKGTLELCQTRLGPNHRLTLGSRNNLAAAYVDAGRLSDAIALHEQNLKLQEAELGPDRPETLGSRNNLASAYAEAGRLTEAITLHEGTLERIEAKLGADHPNTLISRNNLAGAYRSAGRLSDAIALQEATVERCQAKLGPDHPLTLYSCNNLAGAYAYAGRLTEAITLHEGTLKQREAKLGPDHPDTLYSRHNLASAYRDAGRTAEAIALHEATLPLCQTKLGLDHRLTLYSGNNLANAYADAGRLTEAIALYEETLKRRETALGPDHPDTLNGRVDLASAYQSLGRFAEAEGLFRDVVARRRKAVKPDSPLLANDLAALGHHLLERSRWSEAEPLLRECLVIRAKAIPDDWPRYDAMSLVGAALLGQGRYAEAEGLIVAGYKAMKDRTARIAPPDQSRIREAALRVIHFYEASNQLEKATAWKTKMGLCDLPPEIFAPP